MKNKFKELVDILIFSINFIKNKKKNYIFAKLLKLLYRNQLKNSTYFFFITLVKKNLFTVLQKWYSSPTSVDVLIKNNDKDIVKSVLSNGSLSFNIFIDDVQRAIDEENPATTINEDELGRRGKYLVKE